MLSSTTFAPDLQPLYELTEPQYQAVINQLANLAVALIQHLQQRDQIELAQEVAGHSYDIFVNYDEDIAEHIEGLVQPSTATTPQPNRLTSESAYEFL